MSRKSCSHPISTIAGSSMTGGTMNWTRSKLWRQQHTSYGRTLTGCYMTATHTQNQWALHLQHQNRCKLLFTMSFAAVLRKNMGRNMRLQSRIWFRTVTSDDDIVLHPIVKSCNKVTLSLTPLDCDLRITVCIRRKYGSKVYRIAEYFGLFSKLPGSAVIWIPHDGRSVPSTES